MIISVSVQLQSVLPKHSQTFLEVLVLLSDGL